MLELRSWFESFTTKTDNNMIRRIRVFSILKTGIATLKSKLKVN